MASIVSFGSASNSLPENLGAGKTTPASKDAKAVTLSPQEQIILNNHLGTLKQVMTSSGKPTPKALHALSIFTKDLIDHPGTDNMVNALVAMIKEPTADKPLTAEDVAVNAFVRYVHFMQKNHVEIKIIEEKLANKTQRLTYRECLLIDTLQEHSRFPIEMVLRAGITDNSYFNAAEEMIRLAKEHAFNGFKDGDVLFYDLVGRMSYLGPGPGFLEKITMRALNTNYAHVGVFFRGPGGKPYVADIQGSYNTRELTFGQMSYIRGKRVNPAKFTATKLSEAERVKAQERIGDIFSTIVAGKTYNIGISYPQQIGCVFSHRSSEPNTQLDKIKMKDGTQMLCSEFAGVGLMEAFDKFNKESSISLSNPFSEYELMTRLNPVRLLLNFGPHNAEDLVESGWEDVPPSDYANVLPMLPEFPKHTATNPPKK